MPASDTIAHLHLVEDEPDMAREIVTSLEARGYSVSHSVTAAAALEVLRADRSVAVVIADRMLPGGMDGLDMVQELRDEGIATPILVLSALGSVDDRVRGLNAGGDDYLTKPFAVAELVARVEALRRRPPDTRATTLRVGSLEMDLLSRTVRRGEREVPLLPREFKLLEYMMRRPNQVITPAMLLTDVWHYRFVPQTNVVDVHMGKLRHKIDEVGELPMIHRVRGAGFMLRAAD
ncbi:response regulator transcription factor [Nitrospirillum amazonense]|uniref:response regulator transcription factor n=1 Tax=Nitrospirillum amazonense TaxID=28077 RepID=UPI0024126A65|nr:response regulator transcription factor [Nitrospirillum amazonense]MDG3442499.1 response regulator transcription factor [Nitrospirillum amazonense]